VRSLVIVALMSLAAAAGCGPATVRPAAFPDPEVACPAGRLEWSLEIRDQRATREGSERMIAAIREGLQKSFPGCRWGVAGTSGETIAIEVHRFAVAYDGGAWEAAVEWSVSARDASGHRLTEFEANEEVSRPNYQGSDNEKAAISEAFRKAIERTAKGLAGMSAGSRIRPRERTPPGLLAGGGRRASIPQCSELKGPMSLRSTGDASPPRGTDLAVWPVEDL